MGDDLAGQTSAARRFSRADLRALVASVVRNVTRGRLACEDLRDDSFLWSVSAGLAASSGSAARGLNLDLQSIELVELLLELETALGIDLIVEFTEETGTIGELITLCSAVLAVRDA